MNTIPPSSPNVPVPNNLVWAILSTLFCCLPFGIVSIVYACKVDSLRALGDIDAAREAASKAGKWALAGAIALPIIVLLYLLLVGGLAMLGAFSAGAH